jgi:23S rRNA (cytosine1962-C5)-methyltransferase
MDQTWKQNKILVTSAEKDYELLDSGDGQKLERFGKFVLSRPDPQALWKKNLREEGWAKADCIFNRVNSDDIDGKSKTSSKGRWKMKAGMPEKWPIDFAGLQFFIEPTPFKHVGLFPEQKSNWEWMKEQIKKQKTKNKDEKATEITESRKIKVSNEEEPLQSEALLRREAHFRSGKRSEMKGREDTGVNTGKIEVLNLFGYTGGATLTCAEAGASVVHVDGSKNSIKRAKENAELSGLAEKPIRWMLDDAREFVKRELRRGNKYDGIIMDPPSFGRGDKGQVWKIEEDFLPLFNDCLKLLSDKPLFFLINGYAAGYSSLAYANNLKILQEKFSGTIEAGELTIHEKEKGRLLPCGIFARWSAK